MPQVTLGSVFATDRTSKYDVIQSFMNEDPVSKTPFFDTGLLDNHPMVAELAASETAEVNLPYWNGLDPTVEPNYSNDVYDDIAVPRGHSSDHMRARNCHLNEGWSQMSLVREVRGRDPLKHIGGLLDNYWLAETELRLVATLKGILAKDEADMAFEASAADGITPEGIIRAQMTLGDAFGGIRGYVMNSQAFGDLAIKAMPRLNPFDKILRGEFNGLPVVVSDQAMTKNGKPVVALLGGNAFAYGMAEPSVPLEYSRVADRGNGGGVDTLWTRRNMIVHPLGYDFTSAAITGNGTETAAYGAGWADLANPANWVRKASRQQVPIAFLTVAA